jgi:hypothetical protein
VVTTRRVVSAELSVTSGIWSAASKAAWTGGSKGLVPQSTRMIPSNFRSRAISSRYRVKSAASAIRSMLPVGVGRCRTPWGPTPSRLDSSAGVAWERSANRAWRSSVQLSPRSLWRAVFQIPEVRVRVEDQHRFTAQLSEHRANQRGDSRAGSRHPRLANTPGSESTSSWH